MPLLCAKVRCEYKKQKRNFLLKTVFKEQCGDPCLYTDVVSLSSDESRKCAQHDHNCDIPSADFLIAGTSCTGGSKLNTKWNELRTAMVEKRKEVQTVSTFLGFVEALGLSEANIAILENVTTLGDLDASDGTDNLSEFIRILGEAGFATRVHVLNSQDFYLPQCRKRLYIFVVRNFWMLQRELPEEKVFENIEYFLQVLREPGKAKPVSYFLEPPDSQCIALELERLKQVAQDRAPSKATKWVTDHMDFCAKNSLRWPPDPPKSFQESQWFQARHH